MTKTLTTLLIATLFMGLFSFLSKSKKTKENPKSTILGMVLLEDPNSFSLTGTINELRNIWKLEVNDKDADNDTAVLSINGYQVAIAVIKMPIPNQEVESAADYNYFWKSGALEVANHKGHIIISILDTGKNDLLENIVFSQVTSAVLKNSQALGVYLGSRTLVLKKEFYLENMDMMSESDLPIYNWVYFGLRQENGKQSVYTYGLSDFGKKEMEIVDSSKFLDELNEMMYNLTHYVIAFNVTLNDGETVGITAEEKILISESKGRFLEGKTLKINY